VLLGRMRLLCFCAAVAGTTLFLNAQQVHKTKNIIFVMTDGLRWQEVVRGVDSNLINKKYGKVTDIESVRKDYWRQGNDERRLALMPFLWEVVAKQGQIYGDREKHSDAFVTNGLNFSYPGYSETLCGFADPTVKSNDKIPNPNVTVLEWLHSKREYRGKVAAFAAWDVFPSIFNVNRAGFPVNAGYGALAETSGNPRVDLLNKLKSDGPRVWDEEPFDAIPFYTAMEYLKEHKPRVLFVSFGETDDWAHEGEYAQYLNAAHRVDYYIRTLWEVVQSIPEYRGRTTLVFSPDPGRGSGRREWGDHGEKIPDSKYIWMAFLGPDTPPLGERANVQPVSQNQIAATLAALLGLDYSRDTPKAGQPISDVILHFQGTSTL
jgi:hypothetical protein